MPLVLDKSRLKIIAQIFNPVVKGLRAFFKPIQKFNALIVKLIKWISDFLKQRRSSIFRKATRKLKKLGHLYRLWLFTPKGDLLLPPERRRGDFYGVNETDGITYPCYSWDEDDVEEIKNKYSEIVCDINIKLVSNINDCEEIFLQN
jgi:hypothetical protein